MVEKRLPCFKSVVVFVRVVIFHPYAHQGCIFWYILLMLIIVIVKQRFPKFFGEITRINLHWCRIFVVVVLFVVDVLFQLFTYPSVMLKCSH